MHATMSDDYIKALIARRQQSQGGAKTNKNGTGRLSSSMARLNINPELVPGVQQQIQTQAQPPAEAAPQAPQAPQRTALQFPAAQSQQRRTGAPQEQPQAAGDSKLAELREENELLKRRLERAAKEYSDLSQFITVFFNQDTVENALDTIFASVKNFMKCNAIEFMYLDEPQGLIFLYSITESGIFQWEDYVAYRGTDFEPVVAAQKPDIVGDLMLKDDYPVSGIAEAEGLHSLLRLPCASAESFVGFLDLYAHDASAYTPEDIQTASAYAIAAAFFFENMFLKERLSYVREAAKPKPDRDCVNITDYLEKEFEKPLKDIDENARNMTKKTFGKLMPQQYECLTNIKDCSANIMKRAGYLREYLAITAGQIQPEITRIDVKKLLDEINRIMKPRIDEKTVRLMIQVPTEKLMQILGDYKILVRVLTAILDNALEATKIGGLFRISLYQDEGLAEFAVSNFDSDPIPEAELENIVTPFGMMKTVANKKVTKLFLNLPLVKMYVESMGGSLSISSTPQETMVSVKMPFAPRR